MPSSRRRRGALPIVTKHSTSTTTSPRGITVSPASRSEQGVGQGESAPPPPPPRGEQTVFASECHGDLSDKIPTAHHDRSPLRGSVAGRETRLEPFMNIANLAHALPHFAYAACCVMTSRCCIHAILILTTLLFHDTSFTGHSCPIDVLLQLSLLLLTAESSPSCAARSTHRSRRQSA